MRSYSYLVVTSPPYASNAIDYMRAHKFSLVWFGHSLGSLSQLRRQYIGHDAVSGIELVELPGYARQTVASLARVDRKKAKVLHRYYSEMTRCLAEMGRVLKPGKAAIVVVGSSTMRGMDTQTDVCLGEIGKHLGLELITIAARELDRDKRMMPARRTETRSQIEERMHEEYVIGFLKPESRWDSGVKPTGIWCKLNLTLANSQQEFGANSTFSSPPTAARRRWTWWAATSLPS